MTTFKPFSLSALAAASTLVVAALSMPTQAGVRLNGPVLQGPILQGVTLQGVTLQGISLQGITLQGITLQGITLQGILLNGQTTTGTQAGKYLAVTLPSGETVSLR
ncbi:pentapeptide repeat-containing protein [Nevskia ramosa]|uniref:pentapeptide repeat-containing protein n=1 Tax=Nevskia ramosa TaxID=64002 RepID=UPI00235537AB|nr:pentapeptide repeat-containing protein [Nevskia ramosa]